MKHWVVISVAIVCTALCGEVFAQVASEHYERAQAAMRSSDWDSALRELELAYRESPSPEITYWRIVVLNELDHPEIALDLLREHRAELGSVPEAKDLAALEESLRLKVSADRETTRQNEEVQTETSTTAEARELSPPPNPRPIVGPLLLNTAGVVLVAVGTYGFLVGPCETVASDGTCLDDRYTNPAVSAIYLGTGIAANGVALAWFLLGGRRYERPGAWRVGVGGDANQFSFFLTFTH